MLVEIHTHSRKYCNLLNWIFLGICEKFMNTPFSVGQSVEVKILLILVHIILHNLLNILRMALWWHINCILCIYHHNIWKVIGNYQMSFSIINYSDIITVILNYQLRMSYCIKLIHIIYCTDIFPLKFSFYHLKFINTVEYYLFHASCRDVSHNSFWETDWPSYGWNLSLCSPAGVEQFQVEFPCPVKEITNPEYIHSAV